MPFCGTTTVVFFAGGGGLLLLMHPASTHAASIALAIIFISDSCTQIDVVIDAAILSLRRPA